MFQALPNRMMSLRGPLVRELVPVEYGGNNSDWVSVFSEQVGPVMIYDGMCTNLSKAIEACLQTLFCFDFQLQLSCDPKVLSCLKTKGPG